jgi:hypothetical protein
VRTYVRVVADLAGADTWKWFSGRPHAALPGGFGAWTVSDGTARVTRESRTDSPHPLDPAVWKLESSGPRFRALTLRSYSVELAVPARTAVTADYSLTVLSGWFPWMLLGQMPGQLLWHAQGRKVLQVEQLPSLLRTRIAARFPGLFEPVVPWKGPMSFMRWHAEQRRPER